MRILLTILLSSFLFINCNSNKETISKNTADFNLGWQFYLSEENITIDGVSDNKYKNVN